MREQPWSRVGTAACLLLWACSRELPAERDALRQPLSPKRSAGPAPAGSASGETRTGTGVAVVELFTSEGCSSCPPADRVLADIAARAKSQALPVYALSFHVDYWNSLGWRDRFSSSSYSERQASYAGISANGGVYTPQAVVNGEAECIGSNASRIDTLIRSALQRTPRNHIELNARRGAAGLEISYRVSGAAAGRVLNLAVVDPRAETQVERGENSGEHLAHVNVVRAFSTRSLSAGEGSAGSWSPAPIPELAARRVGVVAYVEGEAQRDISGAAALELP